MEWRLRPSLLFFLCCLLGAGVMQQVPDDQSTLAAVSPSLPASTVPVGTEDAAATSEPDKSTLTLEKANFVPTSYLHPKDPNSTTEEPTTADFASEVPALAEGPVSLVHDSGQPTSTMKPNANVSDDTMVTADDTVPQRNQTTEYQERKTPNTAAPEGSTSSPTALLDTEKMTVTPGNAQEAATAFRTLVPPDPKLESSTETGHSPAAEDYLSSIRSTALHSARTPAITRSGTSNSAVPQMSGVTSTQQEKPAALDVGDSDHDTPVASWGSSAWARTDPLMVVVIAVFIIMLGILALVGFLRYKQRNNQTEFRRLQDLPMDDIMEDTPLSMYSY